MNFMDKKLIVVASAALIASPVSATLCSSLDLDYFGNHDFENEMATCIYILYKLHELYHPEFLCPHCRLQGLHRRYNQPMPKLWWDWGCFIVWGLNRILRSLKLFQSSSNLFRHEWTGYSVCVDVLGIVCIHYCVFRADISGVGHMWRRLPWHFKELYNGLCSSLFNGRNRFRRQC